MNTNIIISNVTREAQFKGAYAKVFRILEADSIFVERFETEDSIGLVGDTYYLEIDGDVDAHEFEAISKIKNVKIS